MVESGFIRCNWHCCGQLFYPLHRTSKKVSRQLQRPAKYNLREFRLELARNIIDLPKFGPSPPLYVNPSRELAPVGTFDVQHCPAFVDDRRDCVVCKKRDGVRRPVFSTCSAPQCEGKYQCHQGEELLSSVPHQAVSFPPVTWALPPWLRLGTGKCFLFILSLDLKNNNYEKKIILYNYHEYMYWPYWLLWSDTDRFSFQEGSLSSFRRWQGWEVGAPFFFFFWLYLIRTSSKETHLNQNELNVRKIMQIFSSSICAPYNVFYPLYLLYCTQICRVCQQYPKEIVHCLFVCSLLTPGLFSSWNNENKLC